MFTFFLEIYRLINVADMVGIINNSVVQRDFLAAVGVNKLGSWYRGERRWRERKGRRDNFGQ